MNRTLRVLMLSLFAVMLAVSSAFATVSGDFTLSGDKTLTYSADLTTVSFDLTLNYSPDVSVSYDIKSFDIVLSVDTNALNFAVSTSSDAGSYDKTITFAGSTTNVATGTYSFDVYVRAKLSTDASYDVVTSASITVTVTAAPAAEMAIQPVGEEVSEVAETMPYSAVFEVANADEGAEVSEWLITLLDENGDAVDGGWLEIASLDALSASVTGYAPAYDSSESGVNDYTFRITALVSDDILSYDLTVAVTDAQFSTFSSDLITYSPDNVIVYEVGSTAGSNDVSADFSVTLTFKAMADDETTPILSVLNDGSAIYFVSPDWLKYEIVSKYDTEDDTSATKELRVYYSSTTEPENGAVGHVRIAGGTYNGSDETITAPIVAFDVRFVSSTSALSFDLSPDVVAEGVTAGSSVDVTFTIVSGDGYCTSLDVASFDVSADEGITATVKQSGDLAIVTVTVTSAVSADVHSVDLTFYDVYGTSKDAAITLTVYSGDIAIDLPSGASAPVITAGGSTDVLIDISNYYGSSSDLQFAVNNVPEGFSLAFKEFSGDYAVFTLTSSSDVAAGTYSADIVVTDKAGRTGTYNLTWTVSDSTAKYFMISPDKTVVTANYNVSTDVVVPFYYAEPSTDWYYSPDISGDFEMLRTYIVSEDESGDVYGTMTITVRPLVKLDETYYYTLTFIGVDSVEASLDLTINVVVPAISLTPSTVTLAATVGSSASQDITYANAVPTGYKFSPDKVPSAFNFALTSSDSTKKITVTITPTSLAVSDDYSGTLIISDDNGKSGSVAISMRAAAPRPVGTLTIASVPDQNLVAGQSKDVALSATNNVGVVKWATRRVPSALTVARSTALAATSGDVRPVYTITAAATASGDYSFDVVASDDTGETKTVTVKVNVKGLDAKMQELYRQGYITVGADGTIMLTAAAFESDSGFETIGTLVMRSIRLKFPVDVWTLYIDNNTVVVAEEGYENEVSSAAGEKGDITPSTDKQGAVFEIDTTSLTVGTHAVKIGAIPTGSNMEAFYNFEPITVSETGAYGVGSASSGCDAGLGMLVSALAAAFFIGRKRS